MRSRPLVVLALVAGLVLAGCQSVNEAAVSAESYSEDTLDDPVLPVGPGGTVVVESFEWGFEILENTGVEGPVSVEIRNTGGTAHNFTIDAAVGDIKTIPPDNVAAGETATGTLQLFAGEYVYYCSIPGHRQQGMEDTIVIESPA